MNRRDRFVVTMRHEEPDEVPHFELVFRIGEEIFGRDFHTYEEFLNARSQKEKDKIIHENLELHSAICEKYDWCVCPVFYTLFFSMFHLQGEEAILKSIKLAREQYFNSNIVVAAFNGGGTYGIPEGKDMLDFSYAFFDKPQEMKERAEKMCRESIELGSRQIEAGAELIIINTDYAFNTNTFLSPSMFREFVIPYLKRITRALQKEGAYVILHTDGNIMPIMPDIVSVGLNGIQSVDPQAGMDIAEVKRRYGDKLVLMGNAKCSLLQTGTEEEIRESTRYAVLNGKTGGGYIFSSSNCIFKGIPEINYRIMLDEYSRYKQNR